LLPLRGELVGLFAVGGFVGSGCKYFETTGVKWVRGKMVADVAGEFDGIGHAARAKAGIGIAWSSEGLLRFVVPPKVKVRRARKDGGDYINQGDGLTVNTEEWGYKHNGFDAISILGHPSSGDGAA
jgi:hypothetical protein